VDRYLFQRGLEERTRRAGYPLEVGMQHGVGRTALRALGAVSLEVRQLHQQFRHMTWAFAGNGGGQTREVGQRRVRLLAHGDVAVELEEELEAAALPELFVPGPSLLGRVVQGASRLPGLDGEAPAR